MKIGGDYKIYKETNPDGSKFWRAVVWISAAGTTIGIVGSNLNFVIEKLMTVFGFK